MENTKQTIWLDCDPGLDDTFAINYAAHDTHQSVRSLNLPRKH